MAVSVDNRPTRLRSFLAAVLTVLILVPAGYLFFRAWQADDSTRSHTALELQGVDYLSNLSPLISALAETESSALQGISTAPASLTAAVTQVAAADGRLGATLGTTQRWSGLRDEIGKLSGVKGDPTTIYQAHVEVSDLALALYNKVRNASTLLRDPDNDLSNLQQAAASDLPRTVVEVSRMGDLSLMLANVQGSGRQKSSQRAILGPRFGASIQFVNEAVDGLTQDLQQAVDDTSSPTLSGNLVTTLDSFRRGVESLTRGANPGGDPNAATIATAQSQLQTALTALAGVLVREMDGLLQDRIDRIDAQRLLTLVAAGLVVLLVIVAAAPRSGRRRRRVSYPAGGDGRREMPARKPGSGPTYASLIDPAYGEANPTRRERSGALR